MKGINFNNVDSSTFKAFATNINKPLISNPRDHYEYIPGNDSTMVFSDGLEDKPITMQLIVEHEPGQKTQALRKVAEWLYTTEKKRLIIYDDTEIFYMAKVSSSVEVESKLLFTILDIEFIAEPLSQSVEEESRTIASFNNPITLSNKGTYYALPIIYVTATNQVSKLKIKAGHFEFTYNDIIATGKTLVIDSKEIDIYIQNGANKSLEAEGTLPYLIKGNNVITFTITGQATITVKWHRRYLY